MGIVKLNKNNTYLQNAELVRSISKVANVDLFVSCKILDLMFPGKKDIQACDDFCHECNRIGLDEVINTYA